MDLIILTLTNKIVELINEYIIHMLSNEEKTYLSVGSIGKSKFCPKEQELFYLVEFLNTIKFLGIPNFALKLKLGMPIMLQSKY